LTVVAAFMVQFGGASFHPGHVSLLAPIALIIFVVFAGAIFVPLVGMAVSAWRTAVRSWRGRRRQLRDAAGAEMRARALMSELCPHGWTAQITVGHVGASSPPEVALDWAELTGEPGQVAVTRRVWGATIAEALDAMVADRRTDETLEQIERGAVADGALWPDL
jgi:hypothetical protein